MNPRGRWRRRRNLRRVPTTEASRRCSLVGFLREIRCSFWGPLLRGFATGICLLADQNLVTSRIGIGPDLCDVCLSFFLSAPFSSRSMAVRLCFQKKSLKKRGPAPYETPRWTVFWLRPDPADPRSLALSSSCACGATCPAGSF